MWGSEGQSEPRCPRPPRQPRNVRVGAYHRAQHLRPVPATPESGHRRAALGPSRGGGGRRAEAGREGQLAGTQEDVPACHAGRRQRAKGMLLGRDNQRVSPGAGGGKVPPAHQRIPRHQGHPWVPKTLPALAQPKHKILAREGHQEQQHGLGAQHPAADPQAGISPPSCNSRKKNTVRTRVNVCSPGSQGENVQQMKMCSAGAFITHQLQDGPFGDESSFSFTKDLSSFV